jgi:hypothetical protein
MPFQCPDEETLSDFLEDRLTDKQRARIENHLADCRACRDQVAAWIELVHGDALSDAVPVPGGVTRHALDAVAGLARESTAGKLLERTHRLVAQGKALIEQLVIGHHAQPVAVRGDRSTVSDPVIRLRKTFGDLDLRIEIEKSDANQALIRVGYGEEQPLAKPIRVVLRKAQREVASMLLMDTPVVFEEIPFGFYALVFIRSGVQLGEYLFELTGAPDTERKS